ncbi:MAG: hypothetical protein JWQ98_726 [Chlorobi bacterium]|nr:hypothetical protein [Chlorobiota bacterium]
MKVACIVSILMLMHTVCHSQNFPDRMISYDPLADHRPDTADFTWLSGARLHAEFSRYSNGSGSSHRWNAKTGGMVEIARWDSTWSIAVAGTTEIIIDPHNDISFNPRAIQWEEGILVSCRLSHDASLQFGGMQRCKHDIDNLEPAQESGSVEERTLIFSSATVRALFHPRPLIPGSNLLYGALAIRDEIYVHILDNRIAGTADAGGRSLETMFNTTVVTGRLDLRPPDARYGVHLGASFMVSLFGDAPGTGHNLSNPIALGSIPFLELGLDLFNPAGGNLTIFARGEWQRDAAILPKPAAASLAMFGIRFSDFGTMW